MDVQRSLNCPQYTGEQLSRASCEVWMLLMVRPWSVSFSGPLLWFLSLQLSFFVTNRSQVWDFNTKNIKSCWKLVGSPCALVYKKFRITCFPKVQHFVGTRPRLWLIKRPVLTSNWVAKIWDKVVYKQLKILFWCWGWSIPLRLHIISTWKIHVLNYLLWDGLYLLWSYWWCNQPMGLTWWLR